MSDNKKAVDDERYCISEYLRACADQWPDPWALELEKIADAIEEGTYEEELEPVEAAN